MEMLDKRIESTCRSLKKLSIKQRFRIDSFEFKKGNFLKPADADKSSKPWQHFDSNTMHWYGPDEHYWFRCEYVVPKELDDKVVQLRLRSQIDEWDDAKNPQFLLFVNGEVMQGLDMNHRDALISKKAKAGEKYIFDILSYTGTLHSEFSLFADIEELDEKIESLYYDIWVPSAAFNRMDKKSRGYKLLEDALNEGINLIDFRKPYSHEFYSSIELAQKYIAKNLYDKLGGHDDVIATCIGHTHIDVAWWWTVAQTREKVVRSFSTVLKLMEQYPDYKFMSSQPQLYVFLKERYPELYEKVKKRIKEKRWEPEGGMWVEADCNLTSGESLARQFIFGKKFFMDEFGVDCKILWLPDVFGYSGALPQIMKKCGIDYFMTTKLAWNEFNEVPYDTLIWRGIDGSEVFAHFISTLDVGQDVKNFFTTYNGRLHPDAIMGGWERYQNKDINNDILISFGYGDGGGGPTKEMLETSKRMEKGVLGIPKVRQAFSGQYFKELEEKLKGNKRLPTWEGEFYFEYHRGTYTSMARNKRSNRKAEFGLMDTELLSVMASGDLTYPSQELGDIWKKVLLNQFHDILPGSSIHEVYEVTKTEYAAVDKQLSELQSERIKALAPDGDGVTVFNTTGFERGDIALLDSIDAPSLLDAEGNILPVQKLEGGKSAVYLESLPPKSFTSFSKGEKAQESDRQLVTSNHGIETPFYKVKFTQEMTIESIFDKQSGREVIKDGEQANLFRMYEDKPFYYDNWNIDIFYTEKSWDITKPSRSEWTETGPVRATLENEYSFSNSRLIQKIHFYADIRRIDFETWVDWKESQHLLKVHFPVNIHTDEAAFDVQFGNLTRKTHSNTSWDMARFESCGQKWIDLSEGHYGVSLLNDCKYGHSVKDSNIGLTLIKSGIEPNPTTDQEEHFFTYSLLPHAGTWREADTVAQSYFINQPLLCTASGTAGKSFSLASVTAGNIVIETVKKAEASDATVVRMYECDNALTNARLFWNKPFSTAEECNMLEQECKPLNISDGAVELTFKPLEVKTVIIS